MTKTTLLTMDHAEAIAQARPQLPPGLADRTVDIWEPLLVLADLAGGEWPRLAREAAVRLSAIAQEGSPMSVLLMDVALILAETEGGKMFSRDLVGTLNAIGDRPWEVLRVIPFRRTSLYKKLRHLLRVHIFLDGGVGRGSEWTENQ